MDSTQTQLSTSERELHQRSTSTSTKLPYKYFLTAWVQNSETPKTHTRRYTYQIEFQVQRLLWPNKYD